MAPEEVRVRNGDGDRAAAKVAPALQQRQRRLARQQRAQAGRVAHDLVEGQGLHRRGKAGDAHVRVHGMPNMHASMWAVRLQAGQ